MVSLRAEGARKKRDFLVKISQKVPNFFAKFVCGAKILAKTVTFMGGAREFGRPKIKTDKISTIF